MRPPSLLLALVLLISSLLSGCLELPMFSRPDAPTTEPFVPAAFAVASVRIESFDARVWEATRAPRRPRIFVAFNRPPDPESPVYLIEGALDEDLTEDLTGSPLRAATLERVVAVEVTERAAVVELTPREPLRAGSTVVVAVGAWARSGTARLGTPYSLAVTVSDEPALGARATDTWPPDGISGLAPTAPLFAMRFDGEVAIDPGTLVLVDASDVAVDAVVRSAPCSEIGWGGPSCVVLEPTEALRAWERHELRLGHVLDATGAPLPPCTSVLTTGETADPPALADLECAVDEISFEGGCLLVDDHSATARLRGAEPLRAALDTPDGRVRAVLSRGEGAIGAVGLAPETSYAMSLQLTNASGMVAVLDVPFETTEPLAALAIVEVRSDPLGREPAQEYVELENRGTVRVDLGGMHLADALEAEGDALPSVSIAPGARVLVVAEGFDPDDTADARVPPGIALVRVDASIGSGGLASYGEPLFLRDAMDRRLSASPAIPSAPGVCLVRVVDDTRRGDLAAFAVGPCTPGTAP